MSNASANVTAKAAKKKSESIAQLAAQQFKHRTKGIKSRLTDTASTTGNSNAHAFQSRSDQLRSTADARSVYKAHGQGGRDSEAQHNQQSPRHGGGNRHPQQHGGGDHQSTRHGGGGHDSVEHDTLTEHSKSGHESDGSFSYLDLEESHAKGMIAFEKKMVLNARKKPKFDDTILQANGAAVRTVMLDDRLRNGAQGFARNSMQTARYSVATFVPLCLLEQMLLPINIIFIVLILVNMYNPVSYQSSFLSLEYQFLIWVGVRMVKELSEDLKRAWGDGQENMKRSLVLDPNQLRAVSTMSSFVLMAWGDMVVGDIVKVLDGESFPADMILLATEPLEGQHDSECFVDTSNIDGDCNYKLKRTVDITSIFKTGTCLRRLKGALRCDRPGPDLETFTGSIGVDVREAAGQMQREETERCKGMPLEQLPKVKRVLKEELGRDPGKPYSHVEKLSMMNLVLRGTKLAYTASAIGVIVYAGHETKVAQNWINGWCPVKRSHLMKALDRVAVFLLGLSSFFAAFSVVGNTLFSQGQFFINLPSWIEFLGLSQPVNFVNFWHMDLGASETSQLLIPYSWWFFMYGVLEVSVWVILELVATSQGVSVTLDAKMREIAHKLTNKASMINSNVSADLGQVEHIFCEKNGLMTSGNVQVARINVNGLEYAGKHTFVRENQQFADIVDDVWHGDDARSANAKFMLTLMAICHSATSRIKLPRDKLDLEAKIKRDEHFYNKEFSYRSSSPYEVAMVESAKSFGYEFKARKGPVIHLAIVPINQGHRIAKTSAEIEVLAISSISSRGRSSVVVRYGHEDVWVYCKGWARDMIDRCVDVHRQPYDVTGAIERYRQQGFSTMVFAKRKVPLCFFYNVWYPLYLKARNLDQKHPQWADEDPITRERLLQVDASPVLSTLQYLADTIECNLRFVGLVAFEEVIPAAVPPALTRLQSSGIKIWVSSCDSTEMAASAAYATGLVRPSMHELTLFSDLDAAPGKVSATLRNERRVGDPVPDDPDVDPRNPAPEKTFDEIHAAAMADRAATELSDKAYLKKMKRVSDRLRVELNDYAARYLNQPKAEPTAVIMDSTAMDLVLNDSVMSPIMFALCDRSECIIVGSCSPAQKRRMIRFVKSRGGHLRVDIAEQTLRDVHDALQQPGVGVRARARLHIARLRAHLARVVYCLRWIVADQAITLGVARSANDIAMMREAHVGVAVGNVSLTNANEAVLMADYTIPRFHMLPRLVLVHGHWSYHRLCLVARICTYKVMLVPICMFVHGLFDGFSGVFYMPEVLVDVFNLFMTTLTLLVLGARDRDVQDDTCDADARVYFYGGTKRSEFGIGHTLRAVANGILHGMVVFVLCFASINALESMGFTKTPALLQTSALDNNTVGSLYATGILVYVAATCTANFKVMQQSGTFSLNYLFITGVSITIMTLWLTVAGSLDVRFYGDAIEGRNTLYFAAIAALVVAATLVIDGTFARLRYHLAPSFIEKVKSLEDCARRLRLSLVLAKAIDPSVTFADVYATLRMRLIPQAETRLAVSACIADRIAGAFTLLNDRVWHGITGQAPPPPTASPEPKHHRNTSLSSSTTTITEAVERTADNISVRRLSVQAQSRRDLLAGRRTSTTTTTTTALKGLAGAATQAAAGDAPARRMSIVQRMTSTMSNATTTDSTGRRSSIATFFMMQSPSASTNEASTRRASVKNFAAPSTQPLTVYTMRLARATLRFQAAVGDGADPLMASRARADCDDREASFRCISERRLFAVVRVKLFLLAVALLAECPFEMLQGAPLATPRALLVVGWIGGIVTLLDRFRSGGPTRLNVALLLVGLSVIKTLTMWPTAAAIGDDAARRQSDLTLPAFVGLLPALLYPFLVLTQFALAFVDGVALVAFDAVTMNAAFIGMAWSDLYFAVTPVQAVLFDLMYAIVAVAGGATCYAWERRQRLLFLQERRYRLAFHLSTSVVQDMVPNAGHTMTTVSEKRAALLSARMISEFREYVARVLSRAPTIVSPNVTVLVVGIDNLPRLIQHRTPSQAIALLSKVHDIIETVLKRNVARIEAHCSVMGAGQGALLVASAGHNESPSDSAVEMARVAVQLAELNDPRVSHALFGVMLTLAMGVHSGWAARAALPEWDVADTDAIPPRIYTSVFGDAMRGARSLQTIAGAGQIFISATTYQLVRHAYVARPVSFPKKAGGSESEQRASSRNREPAPSLTRLSSHDSGSGATTTTTDAAAGPTEPEPEPFSEAVVAMLRSRLTIADRRRCLGLRTVRRCFTGSDVVDLLVSNEACVSRFDAVRLGSALRMHNVIVGAVDADRDFVDSASEWYRFRIAPDVDLKRVVRTIRRALPVATHQRWCRAYPKTFTGAACVDLILAHKLAGSRDEAVEIASYLTARSFLQDAIDPRRPFRDGRRALFRLNSAERVDAQALALGLQNNLRFETRLYKGAAFDNCFLGRDAVAFMIEAGLANSVAQALDFGNYLKSLDRLHHAQNPSLPLMNTNDPYRLAHVDGNNDEDAKRASLRLAFTDGHRHVYRLVGPVKAEFDHIERAIDTDGYVKHLGVHVRLEEQDASLQAIDVPLHRWTLRYDVNQIVESSAFKTMPWATLEDDFGRYVGNGLVKRLAAGYDKALALGVIELLTNLFFGFDAAGFTLLFLYLVMGGGLSALIQSPVWSARLTRFLEQGRFAAGVYVFQIALQAINAFGYIALLTSRNRYARPNLVTTLLAVAHCTATLDVDGLRFVQCAVLGLSFAVVFVLDYLVVLRFAWPLTALYLGVYLAAVSCSVVASYARERTVRQHFFLEWLGNEHRQTVKSILPRLVPRPIASALDTSFEPRGWLCNNVSVAQVELVGLPALIDRFRAAPHEAISIISLLFEDWVSICHEYSCIHVLSAGGSFVFVCGLRHAQEEFEFDDDDAGGATKPDADVDTDRRMRLTSTIQAALRMIKRAGDLQASRGDLPERCLDVAGGMDVGGLLSAILPGMRLRHSVFGGTVDSAARLALSCPPNLLHCSNQVKRAVGRQQALLAFARTIALLPSDVTYFVRLATDPFPSSEFTRDTPSSTAINSVNGLMKAASAAKRFTAAIGQHRRVGSGAVRHRRTSSGLGAEADNLVAEVDEQNDEADGDDRQDALPGGVPPTAIRRGSLFAKRLVRQSGATIESSPKQVGTDDAGGVALGQVTMAVLANASDDVVVGSGVGSGMSSSTRDSGNATSDSDTDGKDDPVVPAPAAMPSWDGFAVGHHDQQQQQPQEQHPAASPPVVPLEDPFADQDEAARLLLE